MSLPLFIYFLNILNKYRGDFFRRINRQIFEHVNNILNKKDFRYRYKFKKINADFLKKEPHDSFAFLQFFEFN